MAFAPTANQQVVRVGAATPTASGYEVSFSYTEAGTGSEVVLVGVPEVGRIRRISDENSDGSGATRTIVVHTATSEGGRTVYESDDTAVATAIDDAPNATYQVTDATEGALFLTIKYASGSDNDGDIVVQFIDDWAT